jgi:LytS/YehU family sensor histidine kinase
MRLIHPGAATTSERLRQRIRARATTRRHILGIEDRRRDDLSLTNKKEGCLFISKTFCLVAVLTIAFGLAACGRTPGTRAVTGGLIGAGGGAAVGSATGLGAGTGALIGGAGGAGAGALTGHH